MADMETLLRKFGFEVKKDNVMPMKINKKLILKQMASNGLLLEDSIDAMINGRSGHKKGIIRVSSWGSDNQAEVLLGKLRYHCADFLIANSEDELTREDELKRTDAHFRYHYFGTKSQDKDRFMGVRERELRPLKWEIIDVKRGKAKVGARVIEEKDEIYFYDRDYWLKHVSPLIQRGDNEVEIYMALFNYACVLNAGLHGMWKAYGGEYDKDKDFARRLERNVNGLLRMLRMNRDSLVVKRKMPLVRGREVEDLYKKVFMDAGNCELFKIKCKSAKGECVNVEPYWIKC